MKKKLAWVAAVIFGIAGLMGVFHGEVAAGLLFITVAAMALPPLWEYSAFRSSLQKAKKLIIEARYYQEGEQQLTFDVHGFTGVRQSP